MANTRSAAKQARKAIRNRANNRRVTGAVKEGLKNVRAVLAGGKKADAQKAAREFIATIDRAVKTGQVHRNSAARHKSTLARALAKLS